MKFKPLGDNVLVRMEAPPDYYIGTDGLPSKFLITGQAREDNRPNTGYVLAIGPGGFNPAGLPIEMVVKPGDRILFEKHAGSDVIIEGEPGRFVQDCRMIKMEDVRGVVGNEEVDITKFLPEGFDVFKQFQEDAVYQKSANSILKP